MNQFHLNKIHRTTYFQSNIIIKGITYACLENPPVIKEVFPF